jgi:hypothetical protein
MFGYKKLLMTAAMGVGLLAVPTYAQYNQGYPGNYSHDSERNAYQQGVKDAQWDNTHGSQNRNRNWKNDYDARAYRDGYNSAIQGNGNRAGWHGDHDRDHDRDDHRGNGAWNNSGTGYGRGVTGRGNVATQTGYQDGVNDGMRDAQGGHSYRPTEIYGYKDANHGQSQSGMDKEQYKQYYRQAYLEGYKRGYYQNRR